MSPRSLLPLCASLALLLATSSPAAAQPPPAAPALFDATVDSVRQATLESMRELGYKVREGRAKDVVSGRRTRVVGRMNEEEATQELKQIYRAEPRVGIDTRGMSEYYVTLTARIGSSEGRTAVDVTGAITAVFRRRGGAGAPLPVALSSNGVVEQELVQRIRDRLAHGTLEPTPPQP
jgi:hypothetical protein